MSEITGKHQVQFIDEEADMPAGMLPMKEHQNTDREIYREETCNAGHNSLHVTAGGGIGINVGGRVLVAPLEDWHAALEQQGERTAAEYLIAASGCQGVLVGLCEEIMSNIPAGVGQSPGSLSPLTPAQAAFVLSAIRAKAEVIRQWAVKRG